jgi:hypothetical protein
VAFLAGVAVLVGARRRRVLDTDVATRQAVAAAGSALVHDRYDSNGYVSALSSMLGSLASEPRPAPGPFTNCSD